MNSMEDAALHKEGSNQRLDIISNDNHATVSDPEETEDREADSMASIMQHSNQDDTSTSTGQLAQAGNQQLESYSKDDQSPHLPEGSAMPSTRFSHAFGFASLGTSLAMGMAVELTW